MEEWFLELSKPWWYPGDDVWTSLNRWGVVVYTLVSVVFVVGFYKMIRREWPWYMAGMFILNVLATFAVYPLMGEGEPVGLLRGAITMSIALVSIIAIDIWMYPRSKVLFALLLPYSLWLLPITALTWELLRLNG